MNYFISNLCCSAKLKEDTLLASLSQDLTRKFRFTRKLHTDNVAQIKITKGGGTSIMGYDHLRLTGADREVRITVGNLRVRIKMNSANTEVW